MRTLIFTLIVSFFMPALSSYGTGSISSTDGYDVEIDIELSSIEMTSKSCDWGYNYNVSFKYDVRFTGKKHPKQIIHSLWLPRLRRNGTLL